MNKLLYAFSKFVVFSLILIGMIVVAITTHELKHYHDMEDSGNLKEICVLNLPTEYNGIKSFLLESPVGYIIGQEDWQSPELQANILMFFVVFVLLLMFFIYLEGEKKQ